MSDELVTVAVFGSLVEADLARGRLEAEGIHVFLAGEHVAQVYPLFPGPLSEVRLMVPRSQAQVAIHILSDI